MAKPTTKEHIEPVKFNAFFDAFEKVVDETFAVLHWTDAEIVEETNDRLKPNEQITKRTFEGWKKSLIDGELSPDIEQRFFRVYKKAVRRCKERLFNSIVTDDKSWQRFAWIMERKFSETWGKSEERENDGGEQQQQITITKTYLNEKNESKKFE